MARILIVEDDQLLLELLREFLHGEGHDCTAAGDAEEARKVLESREFHLVLSDLEMPGESGLDFLRYVLRTYPGTACVMLTGSGDGNLAETAHQTGLHACILKPFSLRELGTAVERVLRCR